MAFFVIAKAGHRVWPPLLALGGVAYVVWFQVRLTESPLRRDLAVTARRFLNFAVFFLLGAFARPLVERWARVPLWLAAAAAVAYVPGALAIYGPTRSPHVQAITALLTVLGITALLGLSRLIAGWEPGRTHPSHLPGALPRLALLLWLTPSLRWVRP